MYVGRRAALFLFLLASFCVAIVAGCGDTFRPIAIPEFPPGPDPQLNKVAVVVSCAAPGPGQPCTAGTQGRTSHINLSGDTHVGQPAVGVTPIHAATYLSGTRIMVANETEDTLSHYQFFAPLVGTPGTITLPADTRPSFLFSNSGTSMFVTLPGLLPQPGVGLITLATHTYAGSLQLGGEPTAITGTSTGTKIFVATAGTNKVHVINAQTFSLLSTLDVGVDPRNLVISGDNTRVYAINKGSGTVTEIITSATSDTVGATISVGASPSGAFFDRQLLRLYVTNEGSDTVSIINVDPQTAGALHSVTTVNVGATPVSVAVLPDGSKAFVANRGAGTVSVISSLSNSVTATIALGADPATTMPSRIAVSGDGLKLAVLNDGTNSVTTINAVDNTVGSTLDLPAGTTPRSMLVAP